MKNVLFKRIITSTSLILATAGLIMCGTPAVKETPKQQPTVEATPVQQPKIYIDPKIQSKVISYIVVMINFDFDQSTLGKDDIAELDKAVEFVKKYPKNKIQIDGYSDIIGSAEYNIKLSERRAAITKEYLVKHGAAEAKNITSVGRGTTDPIGDRKTEAGRTINRRAVILILTD
jgi:outer membrane protein OmpA-like peptidoglycan-associated protein